MLACKFALRPASDRTARAKDCPAGTSHSGHPAAYPADELDPDISRWLARFERRSLFAPTVAVLTPGAPTRVVNLPGSAGHTLIDSYGISVAANRGLAHDPPCPSAVMELGLRHA